jgi:uncharacterized protein (TIGR02594 family)
MIFPEKFKWLNDIGPLPKVLSVALQFIGIKEVPGFANNPVIMSMAKELGVADIYTNDDQAWCALFMNYCIKLAGKPVVNTKRNKYNLLRALWLLNWGEEVKDGDYRLGDIVVLNRKGGGHDTIFIAYTTTGTFYGFGGNQANTASFDEFDMDRIAGVRRYYSIGMPESARKYVMDSGGKVSTNES